MASPLGLGMHVLLAAKLIKIFAGKTETSGPTVTISLGSSTASNDKFFDPPTLTISKGTTVTWKNADSTVHTVTSGTPEGGHSDTVFDSSYLVAGTTFQWTFSFAGTFDYYCTLHPYMKGKVVVTEGNTEFLSSPVPPTSFTKNELKFMEEPSVSGLSLQQIDLYSAFFSKIMNSPFEDSGIWRPDSSELLWTKIISILKNVICAKSTLTPNEQIALKDAEDILYEMAVEPDGSQTRVSSQKYKLYNMYQKEYADRGLTYKNELSIIQAKLSVGSLDDQAKQNWIEREKQLKEEINQALEDWITLGYKGEVEDKLELYLRLTQKKSPNATINEYLSQLTTFVPTEITSGGSEYCPTMFYPMDAFETEAGWMSITMLTEEIQQLKLKISDLFSDLPDLLQIIKSEETDLIRVLTAELKVVYLERPWLREEFFDGTYWKTSDNTFVSDGNIPARGTIPAYVTGMIVMRKLIVKKEKKVDPVAVAAAEAAAADAALKRKAAIDAARFVTDFQSLPGNNDGIGWHGPNFWKLKLLREQAIVAENAATAAEAAAAAAENAATAAEAAAAAAAAAAGTHGPPGTPKVFTVDLAPASALASSLHAVNPNAFGPADTAVATRIKRNLKLASMMKVNTPKESLPSTAGISSTAASFVGVDSGYDVEEYNYDGYIVLTFICRRNKKCPNPNESLTW